MNEQRISFTLETLSGIDPALVEEAGELRPGRRPGRTTVRIVLIAAALVTALAVGAVATGQTVPDFFKVLGKGKSNAHSVDSAENYFAVKIEGEAVPLDGLSPQAMEWLENGSENLNMTSWEELEEFLGIDVINDPVLEGMEIMGFESVPDGRYDIRLTGVLSVSGEIRITLTTQLADHLDKEKRTQAVFLSATISSDEDINGLTIHYGNGEDIQMERYLSRSGADAVIYTIEKEGGVADHDTHAAVNCNGVSFQLIVSGEDHGKLTRDILDAMR